MADKEGLIWKDLKRLACDVQERVGPTAWRGLGGIVGFTPEESAKFGDLIVRLMQQAKPKKEKKVKEKKPKAMKRAELMARLLAFLEEAYVNYNDGPEITLLLGELRKVIHGGKQAVPSV